MTSVKFWQFTLWDQWGNKEDAILKCIFVNENIWILLNISLQFVPVGWILKYISKHLFRWLLGNEKVIIHYPNHFWLIISWTPMNSTQENFNQKTEICLGKYTWKCCLLNGSHFVVTSMCEKYYLQNLGQFLHGNQWVNATNQDVASQVCPHSHGCLDERKPAVFSFEKRSCVVSAEALFLGFRAKSLCY